MLADAEALEADMLDRTASPRGLVRIAVPMSFGQQQVAPLLPELMRLYPDLSVDLHLSDELVDLVAGGFDFALRITRLNNSSLRIRHVCGVRALVVAAPAYAARHGLPSHPHELAAHSCVGYAYSTSANRLSFTHLSGEEATVAVSGPLRVNNGEAAMPVMLAGLGIAVRPEFMVWNALKHGELIRVLPEWSLPDSTLSLVTPPSSLRPARVAVTMDFFYRALSSSPWTTRSAAASG